MLSWGYCFSGFQGKEDSEKRREENRLRLGKEVHTIKCKTQAGQNYDSLATTGNWMGTGRPW